MFLVRTWCYRTTWAAMLYCPRRGPLLSSPDLRKRESLRSKHVNAFQNGRHIFVGAQQRYIYDHVSNSRFSAFDVKDSPATLAWWFCWLPNINVSCVRFAENDVACDTLRRHAYGRRNEKWFLQSQGKSNRAAASRLTFRFHDLIRYLHAFYGQARAYGD